MGYRCGRCKKVVNIDPTLVGQRCPLCNSRTFYKERIGIAKHMKSE
ncbi:MAG: DNA-directed RNA polymerase subunit P [Candidatus Thermoplasmatota archaeon]|jgi:DNA-directed RNA polymerase subunit RPC12/RpoP|nr:DNA-directed RNA polymerase subunit P [Candidatus Thermoplasmatota archaeon]